MTTEPTILHLHLPKTGGQTLNYTIFNQSRTDERYGADPSPDGKGNMFISGIYYFPLGFFKDRDLSLPDRVRTILARDDLRAVIGHFWYGIHEHLRRPWIYVTLLRDPVERVVSLYYHLLVYGFPDRLPEGTSLHDFVTNPPYRELDNDQTRRIAGVEPGLGECTRAMLETAKENLRTRFAVVGVTDRFDEALILLKRKCAWNGDLLYYPRNENSNRPPVASLPRKTLDAIMERNELDRELYHLATELLDEAVASQDASFAEEVDAFRFERQKQYEKVAAEAGEELQAKWERQRKEPVGSGSA